MTDEKTKRNKAVMRYSGMASQMIAIILVSIYGGGYLDRHFGLEKPYIKLSMILVLFTAYNQEFVHLAKIERG